MHGAMRTEKHTENICSLPRFSELHTPHPAGPKPRDDVARSVNQCVLFKLILRLTKGNRDTKHLSVDSVCGKISGETDGFIGSENKNKVESYTFGEGTICECIAETYNK